MRNKKSDNNDIIRKQFPSDLADSENELSNVYGVKKYNAVAKIAIRESNR